MSKINQNKNELKLEMNMNEFPDLLHAIIKEWEIEESKRQGKKVIGCKELASLLGLSMNTVYNWVNPTLNDFPRLNYLLTIAHVTKDQRIKQFLTEVF